MTTSAYTALESLLLFHYLRVDGVGATVFGRISDLLKKNPDVTGHHHYQGGRLSPDALRAFYLERLRREVELEQGGDSEDAKAHGEGANPRKRKKASPALSTVQESLQHQHLIPKLVQKLYVSYRHEAVEQIRAEEERYERLQRELKSIERGEWDEQLRERAQGRTPVSRSPTLPKKSPQQAQKPLSPQVGARGGPANAPTSDGTQQPMLEPPKAAQNGQVSTSPRKKQPARAPSTPQPLAPSASPQPHQVQPLAPHPRYPPPNPAYNGAAYPNISPFNPAQQAHAPQILPSPNAHQARPTHIQSPALGPPEQFPPHPHPPYGSNGAPQYPSALQHSPTDQRFPPQPPGPHSPSGQSAHQQPRPYFPPPGQHPHPVHPLQYAQPPPQAGFMLPPFQVLPQDPSRTHPPAGSTPHYPQVSTPVGNRQQTGRSNVQTPISGRPGMPPMHSLVTQARQSFSTPMNSRSPLSAMATPVSAKTGWKSRSLAGTPVAGSPRPTVEAITDFVVSGSPKPSPPKAKAPRKSRAKGKGKEKEMDAVPAGLSAPEPDTPTESRPEDSAVEPETRSGRSRRKVAPKRTRPGSLASSRAGGSVRDRSRSPSILSHTETVAADNESQAGSRIKTERGTSVDAIEEESVDTPSQMTTRGRAATSGRRKRNAREASLEEPEDHFSTPGPPRTIVAQRFFGRTCAPIMNDIQSHKHASTFSAPVRPKDAEGYFEIIRRPTDLKSIQKAIASGTKQVAAAASDTPLGSPGGPGASVELPLTVENVPPKSIVNAAQLEKELMRMFVNAMMFNPGEEGVVEDAREMFETVQGSVSSWRNVERGSGRVDEGTPTVEEEEVQPVTKRRKV
jgi:hypothetical protein